jgi:hypothetical protein
VSGSSKIVRLEPGSVAFIPFGWIFVPAYVNPDADTKKKVQGIPNKSSFITASFFSVEMARALPENVWKSIATYNSEHLSKRKQEKAWQAREAFWKTFVEAVAAV